MQILDYTSRYCIVGAGSSGIAAAKNLKEFGIPFDIFEKEDDIGGNWYFNKPNSSICRSTHLITSKQHSGYTDFPMPEDYPVYPSQLQAWEYMRSYARHFGLYNDITFNRSVEQIDRVHDCWNITLDNGETRRYRGLIIANGHNWDPKYPRYSGTFDGKNMHSADYKVPDVLRGKRVLVVGGGNSGCDIAVESCLNAVQTFHSTRRGYYYWPKFVLGVPCDQFGEMTLRFHAPLPLRRAVGKIIYRLVTPDNPQKLGIPKPDHKLFQTHFTINSQLLYHLSHGDIHAKPDIQELHGQKVLFTDGSEEDIDLIIYATGFNIVFPFMSTEHLNWHDNHPNLFLNVFHPYYDNLFVIGLIQPSTGQWPLVDYQSQLVTRFIYAQDHDPEKAEFLRKAKKHSQADLSSGIEYIHTTRHYLEVEHYSYRAWLKKLIQKMDVKQKLGAYPATTLPENIPVRG